MLSTVVTTDFETAVRDYVFRVVFKKGLTEKMILSRKETLCGNKPCKHVGQGIYKGQAESLEYMLGGTIVLEMFRKQQRQV